MYVYLVMENIKGSLLVISLEEVSDPQHVNIHVHVSRKYIDTYWAKDQTILIEIESNQFLKKCNESILCV